MKINFITESGSHARLGTFFHAHNHWHHWKRYIRQYEKSWIEL